MRTLRFDNWEFSEPDSEQGLEIAIAVKSKRTFESATQFATAVYGDELNGPLPPAVPFTDSTASETVRIYLQQYAGIELSPLCSWPTYIISNDWNDVDVVLAGPEIFIRYHWWTSA